MCSDMPESITKIMLHVYAQDIYPPRHINHSFWVGILIFIFQLKDLIKGIERY